MNHPMFSIIIATYNRAQYVSETIKSILTQTYGDFELIIIDDGSTDNTQSVVAPFLSDSRIRYQVLPRNQGATYARNTGLAKAQGEWVSVWDSDDVLYPHALETIVSFSKRYPDISVFSAPAKAMRNQKEQKFPTITTDPLSLEDIVCRRLPQNSKVRFAKKILFDQVRYVSKNIDFLVNVGLAERGVWFHINEFLGELRIEDDAESLTLQRKKFKKKLSIERSFFLKDFLHRHKNILKKSAPKLYAAYCYGTSVGQFFAGNFKTARNFAFEACKYDFQSKAFFVFIIALLPALFSKN